MSGRIVGISFIAAVLGLASGAARCAFAQSTNAPADLYVNDKPVDVSKLPVDAATQGYVTTYINDMKNGSLAGFVFVAAPGGKSWAFAAGAASAVFSIADVARQALERCEFSYGAPCYILTIDGRDTRKPDGGWAQQPITLFKRPTDFDLSVVPFTSAEYRGLLTSYRNATGNRALAITTAGNWLYRGGDTIQKAVDTVENDCATSYKGETCILYAINDRVVFEPY